MEAFAQIQKDARGEGPVAINEANIFIADSDAEIRLPAIIQLEDIEAKRSPIRLDQLKLKRETSK
jgi:hypothetical protein